MEAEWERFNNDIPEKYQDVIFREMMDCENANDASGFKYVTYFDVIRQGRLQNMIHGDVSFNGREYFFKYESGINNGTVLHEWTDVTESDDLSNIEIEIRHETPTPT